MTRLRAVTSPDQRPDTPRYVELWGHLEANNRTLRRLALASCAWAFVALVLGSMGLYVGLTRPLAFHIAPSGEATYAGRLGESGQPTEVEARYVAKEFYRKLRGISSLTVEADLADAWNHMTASMRDEQTRILARFEKDQGQPFVAYVKAQNIQTEVTFDDTETTVTAHHGEVFTVRLVGTSTTWPATQAEPGQDDAQRRFVGKLVIVKSPRTEQSPNGLLVAKLVENMSASEKVP